MNDNTKSILLELVFQCPKELICILNEYHTNIYICTYKCSYLWGQKVFAARSKLCNKCLILFLDLYCGWSSWFL